jgi:hypothetical protein
MRSQGLGVYLCPSRVDHGLVYGVQCASRLAELLVCQLMSVSFGHGHQSRRLCLTQNFSKPRSVIQRIARDENGVFFAAFSYSYECCAVSEL